jgi:hypothetical protein
MKRNFLLPAAAFVLPLSALFGSENPAMLLKAKSVTGEKRQVIVASVDATALIGDVRISADEMTLDREKLILKGVGAATVQTLGATIKWKDLTID